MERGGFHRRDNGGEQPDPLLGDRFRERRTGDGPPAARQLRSHRHARFQGVVQPFHMAFQPPGPARGRGCVLRHARTPLQRGNPSGRGRRSGNALPREAAGIRPAGRVLRGIGAGRRSGRGTGAAARPEGSLRLGRGPAVGHRRAAAVRPVVQRRAARRGHPEHRRDLRRLGDRAGTL